MRREGQAEPLEESLSESLNLLSPLSLCPPPTSSPSPTVTEPLITAHHDAWLRVCVCVRKRERRGKKVSENEETHSHETYVRQRETVLLGDACVSLSMAK